jgi:hypothetical protein
MRVLGLDFTSTPSALKPLRVAQGELDSGSLRLIEPHKAFRSMADFEDLLSSDHQWIAGIDFPFGLPQEFVAEMQWPLEWSTYVKQVGARTREEFCSLLEGYAAGRPEGRKQHLRATDRAANARSPMMVFFTPVAKMFYEGAIRLARSPVSVVPVRPTPDRRIVVEAYPSLVAQKVLGKEPYKTGRSASAPEALRDVRRRLLEHVRAGALSKEYGVQLELSDGLAQACVEDGSGDCLDAVLCAVQAAWGWMNSEHNYGLPRGAESEGWIADPALSYAGVMVNSERLGRSFNSSLTRVRPVLQGALKSDPTGETWLGPLLRATSNATALPPSVLKDPGRLRGKNLELRTYADRVAGPKVLERCFELPVPPPASFLRWLLRHPGEMGWPVDRTGRPQTFGAMTQAKRESLLGRHGNDAQRQAQAEALDALISAGTEGSAPVSGGPSKASPKSTAAWRRTVSCSLSRANALRRCQSRPRGTPAATS